MDNNDMMEGINTDVPTMICPPLLHSTTITPANAALPVAPTTRPTIQTSSATVVRPLKRYVRPRAKDEQEKHSRAEERKLANRTAAKASRERQKQAMETAQQENDRLKAENEALLERLATLEQRVQTMERNKPKYVNNNKGGRGSTEGVVTQGRACTGGPGMSEQTYQPARPMMLDQQCPVPLARSHLNFNMATVVYALQMLMHSFALSMVLKTRLEGRAARRGPSLVRGRSGRPAAEGRVMKGMNIRSFPWILRLPGDATPNSLTNLSGAVRGEVSRRMDVKALVHPTVVRTPKDFLRRAQNTRRRKGGNKACIRIIVKKKSSSSGKRMNHK